MPSDASPLEPSSVSRALLPASPLQTEIAEQDGGQQKRHHRVGDRRAFAEISPVMARWNDSVAMSWVAFMGPPRVIA